jgi:hypothetical protein
VALAALGDPSALDTLARARSLARAPEQRLRVTGTEISLRLAFAVRDLDTLGVRRVRMLIDSLARSPGAGQSHPVLMTSLDALTGRARDAVRHARAQSVASALGIPAQLRDAVPPLMILSALGGPADTLRILEARVVDQIAHAVPQDEQGNRRREFLARAASMAFPDHRFAGLDAFAAEGDQLVALQSALMHGDTARTRRGLEAFRSEREARAPETFALDAVVPEAALWLALGDAAEAAAWLDPVLRALPQMEPGPLASPLRAASLGRALLLRARAAERLGDAVTATQCRTMIRILWSDADPFLRRLLAPASPRS